MEWILLILVVVSLVWSVLLALCVMAIRSVQKKAVDRLVKQDAAIKELVYVLNLQSIINKAHQGAHLLTGAVLEDHNNAIRDIKRQ